MCLAWRRTRRMKSMSFFSVAGFTGWPFLVVAFERVSRRASRNRVSTSVTFTPSKCGFSSVHFWR